MGFSLKKWLKSEDEDVFSNNVSSDEFYNLKPEEDLRINEIFRVRRIDNDAVV